MRKESMEPYSEREGPVAWDERAILRDLGDMVRAQRVARGWSQEYLAQHAMVDRSSLSRLERGESALSLLAVFRLAVALKIPLLAPGVLSLLQHEVMRLVVAASPEALSAVRVLLWGAEHHGKGAPPAPPHRARLPDGCEQTVPVFE